VCRGSCPILILCDKTNTTRCLGVRVPYSFSATRRTLPSVSRFVSHTRCLEQYGHYQTPQGKCAPAPAVPQSICVVARTSPWTGTYLSLTGTGDASVQVWTSGQTRLSARSCRPWSLSSLLWQSELATLAETAGPFPAIATSGLRGVRAQGRELNLCGSLYAACAGNSLDACFL